ncbi:MAG: transposase [Gammaproteobacteria bacterium RIFOXYB2_FULL_38_6]|nr:MAG: transposase [Gammaproteobacteria bacterium RIFOXYB2_FULL_38_6]
MELRVAHRKTKNKKEAYRINALLLLNEGWTYSQISKALLLDEETLRAYVKRYCTGGLLSLLKDRYSGSRAKLSQAEIKEFCKYLEDNLHSKAEDIITYIKKTYGVTYTVSGITDLLHREGFVYKKTKIIPGKADAEKQKAFIEEYEKLKASMASEDPIYFGDGVHPTHNTEPHYAWIKKGEDKEIRSNTGRERININGAINIETKEAVVRYDDTLNAQSTIKLLRKIEAKHPLASNIYMIIDNARYYKCHLVKEYLVDSKIKLIFLPPYSPNLNLIERLWKFFRKKVTKGLYHEKFSDFKLACENFFRDLKRYKPELDSLLTENFQIIGARKNA